MDHEGVAYTVVIKNDEQMRQLQRHLCAIINCQSCCNVQKLICIQIMILERGETCDERFPSFIFDVIYAHVKIEIIRFIRVYIGKKRIVYNSKWPKAKRQEVSHCLL